VSKLDDYIRSYLNECVKISNEINCMDISRIIDILMVVRANGGRLFILGVGGSAGNASHAVNDFRKMANIECYAPTDNVSELTARINDDGWEFAFSCWLKESKLNSKDCVLVLSVGGGNVEKKISVNLVYALNYAKFVGASIIGIVGRDGGYTKQVADACVVVPTVNQDTVTPHSEAFQGVMWHLIVSHPLMKEQQTKWESER